MRLFLMSTLFISILGCAQNPYEINEENVTRVIRTLASDEMEGRRAFTPAIDKAAEFISSEFTEIGLSKFNGSNSYYQAFDFYSLSLQSSDFQIDGMNPKSYFVMGSKEAISFSGVDKVAYIRSDDNFRAKFSEFSAMADDQFILIDTVHSALFQRYMSFYNRPQRSEQLEDGPSKVFSLYTGDTPSEISVTAEIEITIETLKNVVGMIEGNRTDEYVLFSAHYDHIGIQTPIDGDSIANGANDDASGTAAVIELARYFNTREKPERTLLFVTFTAEESGGYGSKHFSKQLDPNAIIAMFNIEMIGKPAVEGPNTAWITGFDKSDFGALLQESAEGTIYSFYADPYPSQNLFYRSDNATLARLGVPAHTISTTPIDVDPDYHQVSDEVETLNLEHLTNTISAIAEGALGIIEGTQTPTRVDPANID